MTATTIKMPEPFLPVSRPRDSEWASFFETQKTHLRSAFTSLNDPDSPQEEKVESIILCGEIINDNHTLIEDDKAWAYYRRESICKPIISGLTSVIADANTSPKILGAAIGVLNKIGNKNAGKNSILDHHKTHAVNYFATDINKILSFVEKDADALATPEKQSAVIDFLGDLMSHVSCTADFMDTRSAIRNKFKELLQSDTIPVAKKKKIITAWVGGAIKSKNVISNDHFNRLSMSADDLYSVINKESQHEDVRTIAITGLGALRGVKAEYVQTYGDTRFIKNDGTVISQKDENAKDISEIEQSLKHYSQDHSMTEKVRTEALWNLEDITLAHRYLGIPLEVKADTTTLDCD